MAHSGVIIVKNKGQLIPEPYLEKVIKAFDSCYGLALVEEKEILTDTVDKDVPIDVLIKTQQDFRKESIVFHFGKYPSGFLKDDVQPFVALKHDNGKPALVLFLEGDFSGFAKTGSLHSPEFFAAYDTLMPKLQDNFNLTGHDIDKLMGHLQNAVSFKKEMNNLWLKQGNIVMLASSGEVLSFSDSVSNQRMKYDWGWTTNRLDYSEATFPAKEESMADRLRAQKTKVPGIKPSVPGIKPPTILEKQPDEPKTESSVVALDANKPVMVQCPTTVMGKNNIRAWYNTHAGFCPEGYKNRPLVASRLAKDAPKKILKDFKELPNHVVTPKDTPAPAETAPAEAPSEVRPIIPPEEQKEIVEKFLTTVAPDQRPIIEPKDIQDMEEKYPTFAEQCGKEDTSFVRNWFLEDFIRLAEEHSYGAGVLLFNLRNLCVAKDNTWGLKSKTKIPGIKKSA
jgi:hypothetical protein